MNFKEKQSFPLWILVPITVLMGFATYNLVQLGQLNTTVISFIIFAWLVLGAVLLMRLHTTIDQNIIKFGFSPFFSNEILWTDVKSATIKEYKFTDFWGWGIRFSWAESIKAYTTSGNKGLLLDLKNGQKILIGTHKTAEIKQLIHKMGL
jgi:hypothetical protein